tara:strand:+ start:567 stop:719 length:153 start_codon:yes stop_codon:yes gene_type:complete
MLFKFGFFWKSIALTLGFWIFYGIWGYELTSVTLLSLILAGILKTETKIF